MSVLENDCELLKGPFQNRDSVKFLLKLKLVVAVSDVECLLSRRITTTVTLNHHVGHTDVHAIDGDWPFKPTMPLCPGHEGVGHVVEVHF